MLNAGILFFIAMAQGEVVYQWNKNVEYSARLDRKVADCSGFVLKVLSDAGLLLPDMTSQGLYNYCHERDGAESSIECDSLLFFGKDRDKITHVAISIDGEHLIEVAGAGRSSINMSLKDLMARNAGSRIRPIDYRNDFVAGIKIPFKQRNM